MGRHVLRTTIHFFSGQSIADNHRSTGSRAGRLRLVNTREDQMNRKLVSLISLFRLPLFYRVAPPMAASTLFKGHSLSRIQPRFMLSNSQLILPLRLGVSGLIANEKVTGTLIRTLPAPKQTPSVPVPPPMTSQWDSVYRPRHLYRTRSRQRTGCPRCLVRNVGTTFQVEIHTPQATNGAGPGRLEGVAQDSNGNLYKVTF